MCCKASPADLSQSTSSLTSAWPAKLLTAFQCDPYPLLPPSHHPLCLCYLLHDIFFSVFRGPLFCSPPISCWPSLLPLGVPLLCYCLVFSLALKRLIPGSFLGTSACSTNTSVDVQEVHDGIDHLLLLRICYSFCPLQFSRQHSPPSAAARDPNSSQAPHPFV